MKRLLGLATVVGGLAAVSAAVESTKECGCQPECWCRLPGLRHFRWVLPFSHRAVTPEWKKELERDPIA